jgi:hypothetical protein
VDATSAEEFVGPFASWKNVKDYGAVGDGSADDTMAIQSALDAFMDMPGSAHSVLFFPAGTYRITQTLSTARSEHNHYLGFAMVGEHPATTVLQWDGAPDGDMVHLDMWYGKVSRFTFDGNGTAGVGLYRGDAFSTFCELSDLWFRDMRVGLQLGNDASAGQAEHAVLRCKFERCSDAGLVTRNWNTLDIWVWWSLFEECGVGAHNYMGNFHIYESVFLRSREADVRLDNLMQFAFVNNTSVGSKTFFDLKSYQTWGAQVLVQGNRIYDWTGDYALVTGSAGPFLLLDNTFRPAGVGTGPAVFLTANDQVLVGNTFTSDAAVVVDNNSWRGPLRVSEIDSHVVALGDVAEPDTTLPGPPPNVQRKVFDVAAGTGDDAAAIQAAIDAAAAEPPGTRPVVHLPKGNWHIGRTVTVPANEDLQIVGDGTENGSVINGGGVSAGAPALHVLGPSRAVIRDLAVIGGGDAILIEGVDQSGAMIYGEQMGARGKANPPEATATGLYVNGVEDADVTVIGGGFGTTRTGVWVRGGPKRAAGGDAPGLVALVTGASSNAGKLYDVTDGGELLAEAYWYEGAWDGGTIVADLEDAGSLSLAVMKFAVTVADESAPVLRSTGHRGDLTAVLCGFTQEAVKVPAHHVQLSGDGQALRALVMGDTFWVSGKEPDGSFVDGAWVWRDETSPPAQAGLFQSALHGDGSHFASGKGYLGLPNVFGQVPDQEPGDAIVGDLLRHLRQKRIEGFRERAEGVTRLGLFRVIGTAGSGKTAIEIRR